MLRDIALRGADDFDDILNTELLMTDHAKYLQPQGMSDRLQRVRCQLDMLLLVNEGHGSPNSV